MIALMLLALLPTGLYRNGDALVWAGPMSELERKPAWIDVRSGRFGLLETVDTASWQRVDCCAEEEVSWTNGAVTLSGTLIKPRNAGGPVPAVVMIHGSGGQNRTYFSSLPYLLAHHGIAALVYDKRGVGKSTGNRHKATFYDLADDATTGAKMLAARGDIDPRRIGVFGHSQGGWLAPLAAHRWPGFRFAVSAAGPAVTVDEEILEERRVMLREGKASAEDARKAMHALQLYFDVRLRRATWAELARAIEEAKGTTYDRYIFHPKSEAEVLADFEDYDPAPVLSSLRVPLLAMYAENDPAVTPAINVPRMTRYLALAGNRRSTVKVFDDADHDFTIGRQRYADGYLQFIVSWIARTIAAEEPIMAKGNNARKKETKKPKKDKK